MCNPFQNASTALLKRFHQKTSILKYTDCFCLSCFSARQCFAQSSEKASLRVQNILIHFARRGYTLAEVHWKWRTENKKESVFSVAGRGTLRSQVWLLRLLSNEEQYSWIMPSQTPVSLRGTDVQKMHWKWQRLYTIFPNKTVKVTPTKILKV